MLPLSQAALHAQRVDFIRRGLSQGKSITALYFESKGTDIGMRKTAFLALGRAIKAGREAGVKAMGLSPSVPLGREYTRPSEYPIDTQYRYTVRVYARSRLTGFVKERWAIVSSDEPLNRRQIFDDAEDQLAQVAEKYEEEFFAWTIWGAYHKRY